MTSRAIYLCRAECCSSSLQKRSFFFHVFIASSMSKADYVRYRNMSIDNPDTTPRRYDLEQKHYKSDPMYKEAQRQRSKNRTLFIELGLVTKGDGSQIHHVNGNPYDNHVSNLVVVKDTCSHLKKHGKRCIKTKNTSKK